MSSFAKVGTFNGAAGEGHDESLRCSATNGNYVFAGSTSGSLWIIDKTDPTEPFLASYNDAAAFGDAWTDIFGIDVSADGNTVYLATSGVEGGSALVVVIDATDKTAVDTTPLGSIDISGEIGDDIEFLQRNYVINVLDDDTVLTKPFNESMGVSVVYALDVSDPSSISILPNEIESAGACTEVFKFMSLNGTDLSLLVGFPADATAELRVYDMSNPSSPSLLGTSSLIGPFLDVEGLVGGLASTEESAFAILKESDDGWTLYAWNVSDPNSIAFESSLVTDLDNGDGEVRQIEASHDLLAVALSDGNTGTSLFNVANPASMFQIQVEDDSARSVSFAYPYFFTAADESLVFSWLISAAQDRWRYGDNNVIYE